MWPKYPQQFLPQGGTPSYSMRAPPKPSSKVREGKPAISSQPSPFKMLGEVMIAPLNLFFLPKATWVHPVV